jgi:hypothetical protein
LGEHQLRPFEVPVVRSVDSSGWGKNENEFDVFIGRAVIKVGLPQKQFL